MAAALRYRDPVRGSDPTTARDMVQGGLEPFVIARELTRRARLISRTRCRLSCCSLLHIFLRVFHPSNGDAAGRLPERSNWSGPARSAAVGRWFRRALSTGAGSLLPKRHFILVCATRRHAAGGSRWPFGGVTRCNHWRVRPLLAGCGTAVMPRGRNDQGYHPVGQVTSLACGLRQISIVRGGGCAMDLYTSTISYELAVARTPGGGGRAAHRTCRGGQPAPANALSAADEAAR